MRPASLVVLLGGLVILPIEAQAQKVPSPYDSSWYRTDYWSGEYGAGFGVQKNLTLKIRAKLDPAAPRNVDCTVKAGATYHPWNEQRVKADKLSFVSFSKIVEMTTTSDTEVVLSSGPEKETKTLFPRGQRWNYLSYLAEGAITIEYAGRSYDVLDGPTLLEHSRPTKEPSQPDAFPAEEWMGLTCANGARGWLRLSDVTGTAGLIDSIEGLMSAGLVEYGSAKDAKR